LLIIQSINNDLSPNLQKYKDSLYNILYCKKDLICESLKNDTIWGYKIADNKKIRYMKCNIKEQQFKKGNLNDIKQIKISFKKSKKQRIPANIIGYYELKMPQNILVFKIRDKTNQGSNTKGSQIKTGSICNNDGMKKSKIIEYIEQFDKTYISKNKSALCLELEKILNDNDLKDKKYRYLYGPEETIEYELNKKN